MIQAASKLGLLAGKNHATRMHDLLQDFRNLVHPALEVLRRQATCTEAEANQCKGFLDEILNTLERRHREAPPTSGS
jgi:ElaB/YqjD/DUF883 family membrane-anchored ribosome-binding protein